MFMNFPRIRAWILVSKIIKALRDGKTFDGTKGIDILWVPNKACHIFDKVEIVISGGLYVWLPFFQRLRLRRAVRAILIEKAMLAINKMEE